MDISGNNSISPKPLPEIPVELKVIQTPPKKPTNASIVVIGLLSVFIIGVTVIYGIKQNLLPSTVLSAAEPVTVSLQPESAVIPPDQTFRVWVNSGTRRIVYTKLTITFDNSVINLSSDVNFPNKSFSVNYVSSPSQANASGNIDIILNKSPNIDIVPYGSFELARLNFKLINPLFNQKTTININPDCQFKNLNSVELSCAIYSANVAVNHTASPSPTITPNLLPTNTATPKPSPSTTPTLKQTPTANPTLKITPTTTIPASMTTVTNIAYGTDPMQKMDIYYPSNKSARRTLLFVHGGGFTGGEKSQVTSHAPFFFNQGYTLVAMNYRLSPDFVYPAQWQDVSSAFRYLIDHAVDYGINPSAIILMGHSAGAIITSGVSTDESFLQTVGLNLSSIRCTIGLDGVYDFTIVQGLEPNRYAKVLELIGLDPANQINDSPISHVAANKNIPPMILAYTDLWTPTQPQVLTKTSTLSMSDTLTKALIYNQTYHAIGEAHGALAWNLDKPNNGTWIAIHAFLDNKCKIQ
jgi:hypothetical protein